MIQIHCKHDELVSPKKLKNHPKNRNKHGQDQIDRLADLYKYHGIRHPIIVSKLSGFIVAGHGRKLAAIRANIEAVPVVYQDFESTDAEYAFIQADNAIALWAELDLAGINQDIGDLGPDFDINMLGIQDFTIDVADKEFEGDPDEVPEVVEPVAKLGQIYKLGEHRLMCGDSTDENTISALMNGQKADMVFTDPPYGVNFQSNMRTKSQKFDVLENDDIFLDGWVGPAISNSDGFVFVWTTWKVIQKWLEICSPFGNLSNMIIWDKGGGGIGDLQKTFSTDYEIALCYNRGAKIIGKRLGSVWSVGKDKSIDYKHPTQKPVDLPIMAISNVTKSNDKVLDLFGGSGSTLIACEKTNRKCFLMELDPHYVDVIIARWEKFTGQKAELLSE